MRANLIWFFIGCVSVAFSVSSNAKAKRIYLGYEPTSAAEAEYIDELEDQFHNHDLFAEILDANWEDIEDTRIQMAEALLNRKRQYQPPTQKGHYWSHRGWVQKLECSDSPHFSKPIRTSITSRYGRRSNPFNGRRHVHAGVDFRGGVGTPVLASDTGTVRWVKPKGRYGKTIIIKHKNGFTTLYAHLSKYAVDVGDHVNKGQTIGYVGRTGRVTGPHLHFEVRCSKVPVNPVVYLEKQGKRALVSVLRRRLPGNKSVARRFVSRQRKTKAEVLRSRKSASVESPRELMSGAF